MQLEIRATDLPADLMRFFRPSLCSGCYVCHITQIFRQVKRVLRRDGTLWLNLGDSYASGTMGRNDAGSLDKIGSAKGHGGGHHASNGQSRSLPPGLKPKDLCMIPARVALALQADGWWLRSDIIWSKPNPMPESVTDRPTRSHEYLFLLTKQAKYFYDAEAIKEEASPESHARYARGRSRKHKWADGGPGNQTIARSLEYMREPGVNPKAQKVPAGWDQGKGGHRQLTGRYRPRQNPSFSNAVKDLVEYRNKRSVWTLATQPYKEAHFATFPEKLVEPCILAGSRVGDIVLDPFAGSGVTGVMAKKLGRKAILIDLKREYLDMAVKRLPKQERLPLVGPAEVSKGTV